MRVEAGASSREDVQEGMDGGGRVTQVQDQIYKFLGRGRKCIDYQLAVVSPSLFPVSPTQIKT